MNIKEIEKKNVNRRILISKRKKISNFLNEI